MGLPGLGGISGSSTSSDALSEVIARWGCMLSSTGQKLHCRVPRDDRLDVQLAPSDKEGSAGVGLGFGLQYLLSALPSVIVAGIPTVERAVINKKEDDTT